jgi:hypothetical protein
LIDIKKLRDVLEEFLKLSDTSIIIKRKKKIMLEANSNGKIRTIRRNVIKIEIIE